MRIGCSNPLRSGPPQALRSKRKWEGKEIRHSELLMRIDKDIMTAKPIRATFSGRKILQ